MLATEQECSENTDARGDRIDRVSQREVCEGLQQGIVGIFLLFLPSQLESKVKVQFRPNPRQILFTKLPLQT